MTHPKALPEIRILRLNAVGQFLRFNSLFPGGPFDLLPMFVRTGKQPYIESHHPFVASDRIAHDRRIGASQVGWRVDVVERGCDVKRIRHGL